MKDEKIDVEIFGEEQRIWEKAKLISSQALEVSGEAVEAEFECLLRSMNIEEEYDKDVERLISRICRMFKEEKKNCSPVTGILKWSIEVTGLRANPTKDFSENTLKINR